MLAAGELNAACAFVRDFPAKGYEVVDAFLALGDVDRAKNLFEHLEPLSQLHTSRFEHYGHAHNVRNSKSGLGGFFISAILSKYATQLRTLRLKVSLTPLTLHPLPSKSRSVSG